MEITQELIETLYKRINQYCHARHGKEPDKIFLYDGNFTVRYETYCCGETDYDDYDVDVANLTEDLDTVADERKKRENEEKIKQAKYQQEQDLLRKKREKEERKQRFLQLKKEFEP